MKTTYFDHQLLVAVERLDQLAEKNCYQDKDGSGLVDSLAYCFVASAEIPNYRKNVILKI